MCFFLEFLKYLWYLLFATECCWSQVIVTGSALQFKCMWDWFLKERFIYAIILGLLLSYILKLLLNCLAQIMSCSKFLKKASLLVCFFPNNSYCINIAFISQRHTALRVQRSWFETWPGQCVLFLDKTLQSCNVSLHSIP